jgi:hypothetical protein
MPDQGDPDFFISRAGADAAFASVIGHILEDAGHRVVLQQWDFANRNFMERIQAALSSGARVIALLSNDYLASKYCEAEWLNALAGDPLNNDARLVVLRISECKPMGLLSGLAYWDLVPVRDRFDLLHDIVLTAVQPGRCKDGGPAALPQHLRDYLHAARPVLHPEIRPTASFTGRADELDAMKTALQAARRATMRHYTKALRIAGLGGGLKS